MSSKIKKQKRNIKHGKEQRKEWKLRALRHFGVIRNE